jgi:hypothetical protein
VSRVARRVTSRTQVAVSGFVEHFIKESDITRFNKHQEEGMEDFHMAFLSFS